MYAVEVKRHAKLRAAERFPGMKLARIVDEVRDAIRSGRLSKDRPSSLAPPVDQAHAWTLYAWTPDGQRIYALASTTKAWVVMTVMKANHD